MEPDQQLVSRMRGGDQGASDELYRRHSSSVYALVYALLRDPDSADAVVTSTFRRARRRSGEFHSANGSVFAWLSALARQQARTFGAARARIFGRRLRILD